MTTAPHHLSNTHHRKENPMSNLYNIPAPKSDETPNEVHARQMAEYPHNHGAGLGEPFISRNVTQDHAETPCESCGRRTAGESYAHDLACSEYVPHPDSIAGQPGYAS